MRCGTSRQGLQHASFPIAGWRSFKIPVYATGGYLKKDAPITAASELRRSLMLPQPLNSKLGIIRWKKKLNVSATREAIGDAMLMLDMNACYDLNECIRFQGCWTATLLGSSHPLVSQLADFAKYLKPTIPLSRRTPVWSVHGSRLYWNGGIKFIQMDSTRH